jgi:hypothetical protein
MTDLSLTIDAKVDQLTADELLGGPRTITVTRVAGNDNADQPISIFYEGDNGKPFKPCRTMRRLLVNVWGPDGSKYPGRRMTVYRDGDVSFGGLKVGGVRISHVSDIPEKRTVALTQTRGKKAPVTVHPLKSEPVAPSFDWTKFEADVSALLKTPHTLAELTAAWDVMKPRRIDARSADVARAGKLASAVNEKIQSLTNSD